MNDIGKIRPSVKSAIMYEEMTGRNFLSMDANDTDMLAYMYTTYACSVEEVTFDAFLLMLQNKKFSSEMSVQWKHFERFMRQFKKEEASSGETADEKTEELSMKNIAELLVFKYGLEPKYVFDEVELWELNYLIEMGENAYHARAEEKRLWTYMQVLPHMDPKKAKNMTPSKLFPFVWEENVHTKEGRQRLLEKESERMKKTVGMKLKLKI